MAEEKSILEGLGKLSLSSDDGKDEESDEVSLENALWKLDSPMKWLKDADLVEVFIEILNKEEQAAALFDTNHQSKDDSGETGAEDEFNDNDPLNRKFEHYKRNNIELRYFTFMWLKGKYDEALERCLKLQEKSEYSGTPLGQALDHIASVSRAMLDIKLGNLENPRKMLKKLRKDGKRFHTDKKVHSYILAWKAGNLRVCRDKADLIIVNAAREAWSLNDNDSLLCFLCGQLMSQARHHSFPRPLPSVEEITYLKCARVLEPNNHRIAVFLARTYFDVGITSKNPEYFAKANLLLMNVMKSYKELTAALITRSVSILVKDRNSPVGFLEECIRYAVSQRPDKTIVRHQAGEFFFRIRKFEDALENFEVVRTRLPFLIGSILTLKYKCKKPALPSTEAYIDETVSSFQKEHKVVALMGVSEYYLLCRSDVTQACSYYMKAKQVGEPHKIHFTNTVPRFKRCYEKILLDALLMSDSSQPIIQQQAVTALEKDGVTPQTDFPRFFDLRQFVRK